MLEEKISKNLGVSDLKKQMSGKQAVVQWVLLV